MLDAINREWLPSSSCRPTDTPPFFERYDHFNPQTGAGNIEIWMPVDC